MTSLRRVYLDSTAFIDMVKADLGKTLPPERESDVWLTKRLLEAHRDKEIKVLTSTLTIAECTHAGDGDASVPVQTLLNKLLMSGDYVELVQMTPFVATDARDLRWVHGVNLKGADAIHVASAISGKCEEFITANGRFGRLFNHKVALEKLGVMVVQGRDTECLPNKYRQLGMLDDPTKH